MKLTGYVTFALIAALAAWGSAGCSRYGVGSPQKYTVVDVGTLGGGNSSAAGINDNGDVVGRSQTSGNQTRAFLWSNGTLTDLGTLGGSYSEALAINKSGLIVGLSEIRGSGRIFHAFTWHSGKMVDLSAGVRCESVANSVNEKGVIVGLITEDNRTAACYWDAHGIHKLHAPNHAGSRALGINDGGDVVGDAWYGSIIGKMPCAWVRGKLQALSVPKGSTMGEAMGINNAGAVVGFFTDSIEPRPREWALSAPSHVTVLGPDPGVAMRVSERGKIVGSFQVSAQLTFPFKANQVVLNDPSGLAQDDWVLLRASGVNASSEVVGWGLHNSAPRGFILVPRTNKPPN